jgi:hypothetical protein
MIWGRCHIHDLQPDGQIPEPNSMSLHSRRTPHVKNFTLNSLGIKSAAVPLPAKTTREWITHKVSKDCLRNTQRVAAMIEGHATPCGRPSAVRLRSCSAFSGRSCVRLGAISADRRSCKQALQLLHRVWC